MSNYPQDAGIPMLTEIIPQQAAVPMPPPPTQVEPEQASGLAYQAPALDEHDWNRMEREIRERVLYQVLERVEFMLEQRVRDSLADVLQLSVDRLASELRAGLQQAIKETVSHAVTQEITKLRDTEI